MPSIPTSDPTSGPPKGLRRGPPGGAARWSSRSHNFLGLHSRSKRWCEWLPGVVLGPGTLEKGGYGLSRHLGCGVQVFKV